MAEDVITQLRQSHQRLEAETRRFSDAELLRKGPAWSEESETAQTILGEWSVKDVMAHIAAWEAWLQRAVDAWITQGDLPAEMRAEARNPDPFNARAVAAWAHLDAPAARAAFQDTFAKLMSYLESLDPNELYRPIPRPSGRSTTAANSVTAICGHNDEHCRQLSDLLASLHRA